MAQEDRDKVRELIAKMEAQQAAIAELLDKAKATVRRAADNSRDQLMQSVDKQKVRKRKRSPAKSRRS